MCGIAGQFGAVDLGFAQRAMGELSHRGPDGQNLWKGSGAVMVHTRLAILELSQAGDQPMVFQKPDNLNQNSRELGDETRSSERQKQIDNHTPRCVLVFNGEIYNFGDLRVELAANGEKFDGHSDTEVLLRLLVREGAGALPKLAGMFAFAFWNEETGEGLLARDALGIKPLYYRRDANSISFASESQVLRQGDDLIDPAALRDFFLWGSVVEPRTIFAPIRQLPAGHLLSWHSGQVGVAAWHRPTCQGTTRDSTAKVPWQKAAQQTRAALEESIRRHLVSDVPVGIFLSGGIDSTAILALARQALGREADLRTFSMGFDDPAYDESSLARRTAEHFGARHTEWRMSAEEGAAEIPDFLDAADQPSIDGFNTWCVSKLARREGMKVVLSGLGGDEFFAGYGSFQRVPQFHLLYRMLGPLKPLIAALLDARPAGSPWRRLAAFLRGGGSWLEAFHAQRGIFTPDEAEELAESLSGKSPESFGWEVSGLPENSRAIVSSLEVTRYMRNQLLRDSDVFSMAHGLELRVPLVDVRLAETLLALPVEQRLRQGKQLLLDAVPEIPAWIRNQPKRGFRFPFQQWMEGEFGGLLASAQKRSPIALKAWYRIWAMAVAMRAVDN